jgi:hypothetical protein
MSRQHLTTYLNDHLAGSQTALESLDRMGPQTRRLKAEIEEDVEVLKNFMAQLGIAESPIRKVTGWLGEKVVAIKTRIDDSADGPLNQLETLELLVLGIHGKFLLWAALKAAAALDPALAILDYDRLMDRAMDQRDRVEELRLRAACAALVTNEPSSRMEDVG